MLVRLKQFLCSILRHDWDYSAIAPGRLPERRWCLACHLQQKRGDALGKWVAE